MKLKIKYLLKILIINYFLLEILCFILLLTPFIPNGLSLMTSVVAHKDFSVQHIPNRTYNFAYKCWESKVFFNKDGNRKYSIKNADLIRSISEFTEKQVLNFGYQGLFDNWQVFLQLKSSF